MRKPAASRGIPIGVFAINRAAVCRACCQIVGLFRERHRRSPCSRGGTDTSPSRSADLPSRERSPARRGRGRSQLCSRMRPGRRRRGQPSSAGTRQQTSSLPGGHPFSGHIESRNPVEFPPWPHELHDRSRCEGPRRCSLSTFREVERKRTRLDLGLALAAEHWP
jgi:hypothetical protein